MAEHEEVSHPGGRYQALAAARAEEIESLTQRARKIEVARLTVFVVGAVAALLRVELPGPSMLWLTFAVVCLVAFSWMVVVHRGVKAALRRAEAGHLLAKAGIARRARRWAALEEAYDEYGFVDPGLDPLAGSDEAHPYSVDLDVLGPASIRGLLGPTPTVVGSATLARWLLAPSPPHEVRERQGSVRALARAEEAREARTIEALLLEPMPEHEWAGFLSWLARPPVFGGGDVPAGSAHGAAESGGPGAEGSTADAATLPSWARIVAWVLPLVSIPLFISWSVSGPAPWWSWGALWAVQFGLTWRWSWALTPFLNEASRHSSSLRGHHTLFAAWESLSVDDARIDTLRAALRGESGMTASAEIRSLERWLDAAESRASMVYHVLSPILFWDIHVAWGLETWRRRAGFRVEGWFDALGQLEALSALATLASDEPEWVMPELLDGPATFAAEGLGHPLLKREERKVADVALDPPGRFLLVTGSNMSGKSTLLRSLGLAAVLAQTGSVVCARSLQLTPMRVFTSMRIRDSLTSGVSLFMAELLRLKALVDAADVADAAPLMYLVDEVLQGTNSEERRIAARRIVSHLLECNAIGAVTTHDLALHDDPELDPASTKVHFRETVVDGEEVLTFDYRLRPGLATSRNALKLLKMVGLDG